MTFADLGLCPQILAALKEEGYEKPSPIQEQAIPPALAGRDVLGCAQTGTGKTCAFAAPILQRLNNKPASGHPIRALILTPTRELAIQIGESFEHYGRHLPLRCAVIFGGVGQAPQVEKLGKGVDILVATPGRLGDLYQQGFIDLKTLEIFVLDEADRMLDMGFIHDVKKILKWLPEKKQTLFFSATMPKEITELVNSLLHHPARVAVDPVSSPVEAIRQSVYFVDRGNKTKLLALLVNQLEVKNALVFTRTKHGANKVARDLGKAGITAAAIHGNKSQTARQQALADFKSGAIRCLVATDIAARGLDIEELSHVFNYNLPEVPETYVHRIGRTGRAGHGGTAIAFCDFSEKPLLKEIEKLIGRSISVVEDHPYPMVDLQAPKRDKNGRIINEDDAQARAAAKEQRRAREEAKKAADQRKEEAAQSAPKEEAVQTEETKASGKSRRRRRKAKAKPEPVQAAPVVQLSEPEPQVQQPARRRKLTRPGSRMDTGDAMPRTDFSRPNPLAGDHIMDATARLLAPRKPLNMQDASLSHRSAPRSRRKERRGEKEPRVEAVQTKEKAKEKAKAKSAPPAPKKKEEPVSGKKKSARPDRRRDRGPRGPIEPMRSNRVKDSTEQKSLMKPYYLDN
ncbi:DEAD/DEAH box helicase [Pseudoflavonifractor phocaeensis]|uniref:DEAD/DEAH box helicase n=1 Tax=Pseudoflavonifractor phocaeensis TaxID=1870988 RepID=UPI0025A3A55B|nr:DEAD/DEAH box helicase [Pseudoflavonifractor phocaeensis]MDM8238362.1 DEAD/DEAH box helicase [Pseudoflavonifractor phocaeensis]